MDHMKKLSPFVFIAFTSLAQAQVTITSNDMPVNAHVYTYSNAINNGSVDVTVTGANQTWDFTQLTSNSQTLDTFVAISQMPTAYQFYFWGSDQAIHTGQTINLGTISISDIWDVYDKNTTDYSFSGYGGMVSGFPVPFAYSPKDRLYNFPMHFGDMDSSTSNFNVNIPNTAFINQDRKRVNEVDGWGTVITPVGSFNCLRVKSITYDHDSISLAQLPFPVPGFDVVNYEYKWLGVNGGEPIVVVNAQDVFGQPQITSIKFQDTLISNSTSQINDFDFGIYPTLADKYFFITAANDFINHPFISIYNTEGKLMKQITTPNGTSISVDTHAWANGIYIVECMFGDKTERQKVLVQH